MSEEQGTAQASHVIQQKQMNLVLVQLVLAVCLIAGRCSNNGQA